MHARFSAPNLDVRTAGTEIIHQVTMHGCSGRGHRAVHIAVHVKDHGKPLVGDGTSQEAGFPWLARQCCWCRPHRWKLEKAQLEVDSLPVRRHEAAQREELQGYFVCLKHILILEFPAKLTLGRYTLTCGHGWPGRLESGTAGALQQVGLVHGAEWPGGRSGFSGHGGCFGLGVTNDVVVDTLNRWWIALHRLISQVDLLHHRCWCWCRCWNHHRSRCQSWLINGQTLPWHWCLNRHRQSTCWLSWSQLRRCVRKTLCSWHCQCRLRRDRRQRLKGHWLGRRFLDFRFRQGYVLPEPLHQAVATKLKAA
mmetsp:Transcript_51405/g.123238  ORF Transcript_51405/g.123238 Transcript_51405/m.123238 type:complete len:309 (-) Transcript_51405:1761-2687(-)